MTSKVVWYQGTSKNTADLKRPDLPQACSELPQASVGVHGHERKTLNISYDRHSIRLP